MAQPTEGEWNVKGYSIYAGNKMILMSAVKDVPDLAERVANLELGAAAPDLLDACTQLLWAVDNNDADELNNGKASARAAIKKARRSELQTKQ